MSVDYNCVTLPDHERLTCASTRKGGICAIGLLDEDYYSTITDFSDATQIQDAIDAGKLKIIKGIRGQMPAPSEQKGDSLSACGPEQVLDSFEQKFTWEDGAVIAANKTLYDAANQGSYYIIGFVGAERVLFVSPAVCSIVAKLEVPNSKKAAMKWTAEATCDALEMPQIVEVDADQDSIWK